MNEALNSLLNKLEEYLPSVTKMFSAWKNNSFKELEKLSQDHNVSREILSENYNIEINEASDVAIQQVEEKAKYQQQRITNTINRAKAKLLRSSKCEELSKPALDIEDYQEEPKKLVQPSVLINIRQDYSQKLKLLVDNYKIQENNLVIAKKNKIFINKFLTQAPAEIEAIKKKIDSITQDIDRVQLEISAQYNDEITNLIEKSYDNLSTADEINYFEFLSIIKNPQSTYSFDLKLSEELLEIKHKVSSLESDKSDAIIENKKGFKSSFHVFESQLRKILENLEMIMDKIQNNKLYELIETENKDAVEEEIAEDIDYLSDEDENKSESVDEFYRNEMLSEDIDEFFNKEAHTNQLIENENQREEIDFLEFPSPQEASFFEITNDKDPEFTDTNPQESIEIMSYEQLCDFIDQKTTYIKAFLTGNCKSVLTQNFLNELVDEICEFKSLNLLDLVALWLLNRSESNVEQIDSFWSKVLSLFKKKGTGFNEQCGIVLTKCLENLFTQARENSDLSKSQLIYYRSKRLSLLKYIKKVIPEKYQELEIKYPASLTSVEEFLKLLNTSDESILMLSVWLKKNLELLCSEVADYDQTNLTNMLVKIANTGSTQHNLLIKFVVGLSKAREIKVINAASAEEKIKLKQDYNDSLKLAADSLKYNASSNDSVRNRRKIALEKKLETSFTLKKQILHDATDEMIDLQSKYASYLLGNASEEKKTNKKKIPKKYIFSFNNSRTREKFKALRRKARVKNSSNNQANDIFQINEKEFSTHDINYDISHVEIAERIISVGNEDKEVGPPLGIFPQRELTVSSEILPVRFPSNASFYNHISGYDVLNESNQNDRVLENISEKLNSSHRLPPLFIPSYKEVDSSQISAQRNLALYSQELIGNENQEYLSVENNKKISAFVKVFLTGINKTHLMKEFVWSVVRSVINFNEPELMKFVCSNMFVKNAKQFDYFLDVLFKKISKDNNLNLENILESLLDNFYNQTQEFVNAGSLTLEDRNDFKSKRVVLLNYIKKLLPEKHNEMAKKYSCSFFVLEEFETILNNDKSLKKVGVLTTFWKNNLEILSDKIIMMEKEKLTNILVDIANLNSQNHQLLVRVLIGLSQAMKFRLGNVLNEVDQNNFKNKYKECLHNAASRIKEPKKEKKLSTSTINRRTAIFKQKTGLLLDATDDLIDLETKYAQNLKKKTTNGPRKLTLELSKYPQFFKRDEQGKNIIGKRNRDQEEMYTYIEEEKPSSGDEKFNFQLDQAFSVEESSSPLVEATDSLDEDFYFRQWATKNQKL